MSTRSIADELAAFEEGTIEPRDFPHREHVRIAYEMLQRYSFGETASRFAQGLRHLARKSGKAQLYHETITLAFLAAIGERMRANHYLDWRQFAAANPDLLDKEALRRWYPRRQLETQLARETFCLPRPLTLSSVSTFPRVLAAYAFVFCGYILWSSARTAWQGYDHSPHAVVVALSEIFGTILFAFARTRLTGAIVLFLVFSTAFVVDLASGGLPLRFVFYAATTAFVLWLTFAATPREREHRRTGGNRDQRADNRW